MTNQTVPVKVGKKCSSASEAVDVVMKEVIERSGFSLSRLPDGVCSLVIDLSLRFTNLLEGREEDESRVRRAREILRGGLECHRDVGGKTCGCGACHAMHGAIRALRGEDVVTVEVAQVAQHSRDEDCAPYLDEHGMCTTCGVQHVPGCSTCGGAGFHRPWCHEVG